MATSFSDDNFEGFVSNWPRFKDRIVVFLGAGASVGALNKNGAPLPNAFQLRNELWEKFKVPVASAFDARDLGLMSLQHAAAIIESKTGRTPLSEYLVTRFSCSLPLWAHFALPYLNPKSIFTTNYDELIELGFTRNGIITDVIYGDRSPRPGNEPIIYKPHGNLAQANQRVGQGGLVITQFDYLEMIADYRKMLAKAMNSFDAKCVVTIGYSFGDMDIGAELYRIRKADDGMPWYAVFPRSDPDVRDMYRTRLGVRQINCTFSQFLTELDGRVNFLPPKAKRSQLGSLIKAGYVQPES